MFSGMWKTLGFAALAAAALTLAACGGGGGGGAAAPPVLSEAEIEEVRSDPRVIRIGDVLRRADALLLTGFHTRFSLTGGGQTLENQVAVDAFECAGARCAAADGTAVTIESLTGSAADLDVRLSEADLGARDGFDTADTSGRFEIVEDSVQGVRVTAEPTVRTYGFWGEHGYAALEIGAGDLTGVAEGTALSGDFAFARAYAAGAATGSNPSGTGSATWSGIVEASPTGAFERLQGSVTLTIADLAQPRVGVAVDVTGHMIDRPGWADMPLTNGGFSSGRPGTDYIEGAFGGPGHEEAWGVFDTTGYLGAFGAKRAGGQ